MKRAFPLLFVLLAGCIVQSFYPFYTDKSKVALPQLNGEWDAVTIQGNKADSNLPPWRISDTELLAYDSDTPSSKLRIIFFDVGGRLFCDSTADDVGDGPKLPSYLALHLRSIHMITRVETNKDTLTFTPLDPDWLTNHVTTGNISLSYLTRTEDRGFPFFTAKPADWERFLAKYANDPDAFPSNHIFVLKRHATKPTK